MLLLNEVGDLCVLNEEVEVAEEKAAAPAEAAPSASPGGTSKKQSLILMGLALVNMLVIVGVGFSLVGDALADRLGQNVAIVT